MRQRHLPVLFVFLCTASFSGLLTAQSTVDKAWSTLQTGLAKTGDDRVTSVRVLGLLNYNAKATQISIAALDDSNPDVRAAAAEVLGEIHARSAVPKLKALINTEKEVSVIIASARALIALGDNYGYGVYYAVLTGERKSGSGLLDDQKKMLKDPKKMAEFGIEQGIGFIPYASLGLGAFKVLTKDDSSPVRAAACRILAQDPDPKSGQALIAAADDKSLLVRAAALEALSRRGDPKVISQIAGKLDDDKQPVQLAAAAAIVHLTDIHSGRVRK